MTIFRTWINVIPCEYDICRNPNLIVTVLHLEEGETH